MNIANKSSNIKTNVKIILGLTLIFVSLAWFGYRYYQQTQDANSIAQTTQEAADQIQPYEDKIVNAEQPADSTQTSDVSYVQNDNEE